MNPTYGNRLTSVKEFTVEHKDRITTVWLGKLRVQHFVAWLAILRPLSMAVVCLALDPLETLVDLKSSTGRKRHVAL